MYREFVETRIQCSKCDSLNIAEPANKDNIIWVYKCINCGHTKKYEPPVTKITTSEHIGYFDYKPVKF